MSIRVPERKPCTGAPPGAYRGGMDQDRDNAQNPTEDEAPLGGDEGTEDQLEADNAAEEETLKTLDPDSPPA